MAAACLAS